MKSQNTRIIDSPAVPAPFRRSRTKLWIRTVILVVFSTLFGLSLRRDIASGAYS